MRLLKAFAAFCWICAAAVLGLIVLCVILGSRSTDAGIAPRGSRERIGRIIAPPPLPPDPEEKPPVLENGGLVLKRGWKGRHEEMGVVKVRGRVVNRTGRELKYAEIVFALVDASGAQITIAMANTNYLANGQSWKFEAVGMGGEGATNLRLAKLSGF